jgi:hypothetical protein
VHPIAPYARHAYAAGLARSGGPINTRTRAGCRAAVALACEHADDPQIFEVTLKLGSLEGTWAAIFDRRDQLAADQIKLVTDVWRSAFTSQAIADMVRDFRKSLTDGVTEADSDQGILARAIRAVKILLGALPYGEAWAKIRTALRNAVAAGRAEGVADAVALAAERTGRIGLDFNIAFTHAYEQLAKLEDLWGEADGWLGRMLGRATDQLGRALAAAAEAGAPYADMLAAATDILDSPDTDAVSFIVDWALNTGMAQGALSLYRSEGVTRVSWLTAGDLRVCPICEENEQKSPWAIEDFPDIPAHPRCRCVPTSEVDFPQSFTDALVAA